MKRTALTFLVLLSVSTLFAQDFKLGPRVGLSSSNMTTDQNEVDTKSILGYHAGIFARFAIAGFYLQPEVLYSVAGSKIEVEGVKNEVNLKRVDIPVLFGKRFARIVRINAGPVFNVILDAQNKDNKSYEDIKKSAFAVQAGVGLDIVKFVIDLKYEAGLSNLGDTNSNLDKSKNNQFIFSVGYSLF